MVETTGLQAGGRSTDRTKTVVRLEPRKYDRRNRLVAAQIRKGPAGDHRIRRRELTKAKRSLDDKHQMSQRPLPVGRRSTVGATLVVAPDEPGRNQGDHKGRPYTSPVIGIGDHTLRRAQGSPLHRTLPWPPSTAAARRSAPPILR